MQLLIVSQTNTNTLLDNRFLWKSYKMSDEENYYNILGCEENSSIEIIKKCYHEKALACHPDKGASNVKCVTSFDKINKAWRTLSDPAERVVYNAKLSQQRVAQQNLVFGTFSLRELMFDSNSNLYTHTCRCGGQFVVDAGDISIDSDISVECDTCSLVIYIKIS